MTFGGVVFLHTDVKVLYLHHLLFTSYLILKVNLKQNKKTICLPQLTVLCVFLMQQGPMWSTGRGVTELLYLEWNWSGIGSRI